MPKRAAQSGETCRTPKVVRNKKDLSERKISRSKLNRKQEDGKNCRPFLSAQFIARCAVFFWLGSLTGRRGAIFVGLSIRPLRGLYWRFVDGQARSNFCPLVQLPVARSLLAWFVDGQARSNFCRLVRLPVARSVFGAVLIYVRASGQINTRF